MKLLGQVDDTERSLVTWLISQMRQNWTNELNECDWTQNTSVRPNKLNTKDVTEAMWEFLFVNMCTFKVWLMLPCAMPRRHWFTSTGLFLGTLHVKSLPVFHAPFSLGSRGSRLLKIKQSLPTTRHWMWWMWINGPDKSNEILTLALANAEFHWDVTLQPTNQDLQTLSLVTYV